MTLEEELRHWRKELPRLERQLAVILTLIALAAAGTGVAAAIYGMSQLP